MNGNQGGKKEIFIELLKKYLKLLIETEKKTGTDETRTRNFRRDRAVL